MIQDKLRRVGILRPKATALSSLYDVDADYYSERLSEMIELIRILLQEAADNVQLNLHTTEYQLHNIEGSTRVVSPKRARRISNNDVLVTLDPDAHELGYVQKAIDKHELQRAVIAFTAKEILEDLFFVFGAKCVPVFVNDGENVSYKKIPRLFPVHLNMNDDLEADNRNANVSVFAKALRYPDIEPSDSTRSYFTDVTFFDSNSREAQKDFRPYFTGEEESN